MRTDKVTLARRRRFSREFFRGNIGWLSLSIFCAVLSVFNNLAISAMMREITDLASGVQTRYTLWQLTAGCVGVLLLDILWMCLLYHAKPRFVHKATRQYKDFAFAEITKKSVSSFTGENTSTYVSALTNDVTSIERNYLARIFSLVRDLLLFTGAFALMLLYSPTLTLAAFLLSLLPVLTSLFCGDRLATQEKAVSDQNESFMGLVKDMLSGFSVVKSFKAERDILRLFRQANLENERAKRKWLKMAILLESIGSLAGMIAQFGVFLLGAYLALTGRGVTAGTVIVFVQLMNFVIMPISEVPQIIANRKASNALIDKLALAVSENVRREGKAVDNVLDDAITMQNVSFGYEQGEPVLHNICARFEKGKSYAVVGASGSGKSTLLNLLIGGCENYTGSIAFDGSELRDIASDSLYDLVSIVQQNVFVFNSTIHDKITLFKDFDADKVARAIRMSGLGDMIAQRGEDYRCGENGTGLSGGERQRISIARCLLRDTPVLLVDEATSALDAATAFSVTSAILQISGLTRIVVTHRLEEALLRKYDQILVLRGGRVAEAGEFTKLMDKKGYFYSLFTVSQ